ncbi:MAG: 50S ribosomal protein L24e [Nanoarchaeota archaeon]|nr:50S ribosomal protein L24e [Nanoarchaeota archaeon]
MPKCTFCKRSYEWPRGISIVQKEGTVKFYCSSKCRKNDEMGRNSKKVKWVIKQEKEQKTA